MEKVETERISATQNFSINLTNYCVTGTTPPTRFYSKISMRHHGRKNPDVLLLMETIENVYDNSSTSGKQLIIDSLRNKGFIVVEPTEESKY